MVIEGVVADVEDLIDLLYLGKVTLNQGARKWWSWFYNHFEIDVIILNHKQCAINMKRMQHIYLLFCKHI